MIDIYNFWVDFFLLPSHLTIIYDILTLFSVFIFPLMLFYPFLVLLGSYRKGR
jgi:hypothetical protein